MDDYVEDYSYNNNFWMKSGVLYTHFREKFAEFMSLGKIFKKFSDLASEFSQNLSKAKKICEQLDENDKPKDKRKKIEVEPESFYIPLGKPDNSTRSIGIKMLLDYFERISNCFNTLNENVRRISKDFFDKNFGYESKIKYEKDCDVKLKNYQDALNKLSDKRKNYFDSINKAIEYHLTHKNKSGKNREKNKIEVNKKRNEYKEQIKLVEEIRVDYLDLQGHVFAIMEEFERDCTNDLKRWLKKFADHMNNFRNGIEMNEIEMKQIEEMDGIKDNKIFAEQNKSLMTGPKRNLFKEYSQDLNYYMENFEFLKKELKGKNPKEIKEIHKNISQEVGKFLNEIITEEPNEINNKIIEIAKKLKESKLTEGEFDYLIRKFEERFEQYLKWKGSIHAESQNYKKVGENYDDRYCYMQTFLGYFNKTRVANKCLNEENFNYFCKAIEKILELNMNEDIDYSLCDLVVILSSTFYMNDKTKKSGKKYTNEVIRNCPIMQKQGFWVGLTKFELNQEIQQQKSEVDTLKEDNISIEKLDNSIIAKLMSVTYNILQFITDSGLFNRIVYDIFKYCKINKEKREIIVAMMENQIEAENLTHIKLDKDIIFNEN